MKQAVTFHALISLKQSIRISVFPLKSKHINNEQGIKNYQCATLEIHNTNIFSIYYVRVYGFLMLSVDLLSGRHFIFLRMDTGTISVSISIAFHLSVYFHFLELREKSYYSDISSLIRSYSSQF